MYIVILSFIVRCDVVFDLIELCRVSKYYFTSYLVIVKFNSTGMNIGCACS